MLDALGNIGEFVGALAVILSVLYLGTQIRQNTKAIRASSYQSITTHLADVNRSVVEDADVARLLEVGLTDPEQLSSHDLQRLGALIASRLRHYESIYFHYTEGLLEAGVWLAHLSVLSEMLANPGAAMIWRQSAHGFPEKFAVEVHRIISEPSTTPSP